MKSCEFVRVVSPFEPERKETQCVWVPRPTSWIGGWARHNWLKKHFDPKRLFIASPKGWDSLCQNNEVFILTEEKGVYQEGKK